MKVRLVVLVGLGLALVSAILAWRSYGQTYGLGIGLGFIAAAFTLLSHRLFAGMISENRGNVKFASTGVVLMTMLKIPVIGGTIVIAGRLEPGGTKGFLVGLASVYLPLIVIGLYDARQKGP